MTITPFTIYLWQQADSVAGLFVALTIMLALVALCYTIHCNTNDDMTPTNAGRIKKCIASAIVCAILAGLTPSTKSIAMMYAVPTIVNSPVVQKDLPEIYEAGVKALKNQLESK